MNKLTKVGCSALCGSLAAISAANAGDITVTGGVDMTWTSLEDGTTGNPIGMGSNLTFKGSGELDNGWTFDVTVAHKNANAYSAAKADITMGGLGSLMLNQGDGNGLGAYDDMMPTAWEEPWGAGLSTGMRGLVSGVGPSMNVQYSFPTVIGTTLKVAYAPIMGVTDTADKTGSGASLVTQENNGGIDITVNMNPSLGTEILSGLNIFAGAHNKRIYDGSTTLEQDAYQGVGGITYDIGPLSIGAQVSAEYSGEESNATTYNTYKANAYGIAFNVNDDLSIGYNHADSDKSSSAAHADAEADSIQAAYTMGGATISFAEVDIENRAYGTAAGSDVSGHVISLGLAF